MKLTVIGVDKTVKNLIRINQNLSDTRKPMKRATKHLASNVKRFAPVDRGELKNSIRDTVVVRQSTTTGIVGSNLVSAVVQEKGSTKRWWPPLSALEGWASRHATSAYLVARAISRRGLRARRYFERALNASRKKIIQIFESEVKKIIK